MNRARASAFCILLTLAASACRRESAGTPAILSPLAQGSGSVEWQGMQPCADCDGIRTRLVLAREGNANDFVLEEVYLAVPQPVPFVTRGTWERDGTLLRLHARDGARLGYAVLDDGRLQPRDVRGRRLRMSDGDGVLAPAGSSATR